MNRVIAKIFLAIALGSSASSFVSGLCSSKLVGDSSYPYKLYQGSTLYDTVRGEIGSTVKPTGCLPISMVLMARHGSRHPGTARRNKYRTLHELQSIINSTGSATLCEKDLNMIKHWHNWYRASLDKNLAITGIEEMRGLSERLSSAFPEIFSNATMQRFIASNYQRTIESARVFKDTSFPHDGRDIEINMFLTRSWEFCNKIRERGRIGNTVERFLQGRRVRHIAKRLAGRLGVPVERLSDSVAQTVYLEGCAREQWATGKDSPWCLALKKRDKQAFEYALDMRDYLQWSFATPRNNGHFNYRHSCQLKQYILSALHNASFYRSHNESATNHFIFAHLPTLLTLLTEMKLIEDDGPFRGREFAAKVNRTFSISKLVPGGGNIAFILYQCADNAQTKLQVFLNERLLKLPLDNPHQNGLWNFEEALVYFGFNDPNDCNWDAICSIKKTGS